MLNLVVLDGMVKLAFRRVLVSGALFSVLDHDEALGNAVKFVLEHNDAFKVDLQKQIDRNHSWVIPCEVELIILGASPKFNCQNKSRHLLR